MSFWNKLFGSDAPTDADKAEFHEAIKPLLPAPVDNTAQFAEIAKKSDILDAKTFALEMLTAGKILPKDMSACVAEFADAAEDDRLAPKIVTFAVGTDTKTGTRVEKVKAKYEAQPAHGLTKELMPDTEMFALFNRNNSGAQETASETKARVDAQVERMRSELNLPAPANGAKS